MLARGHLRTVAPYYVRRCTKLPSALSAAHGTELPSAGVRGLALKRGHLWMVDVNGVCPQSFGSVGRYLFGHLWTILFRSAVSFG